MHQLLLGLDSLRIRIGERPLLLCLLLLVVLWLLPPLFRRPERVTASSRGIARLLVCCGVSALAAYVGVVVWYASQAGFFDYAEPTIPILGWLFRLGQPVYPGLLAPERYAHVYGPMVYLIYGAVFALVPPTIGLAKSVAAAAALAALGCLYASARQHGGRLHATVVAGFCALWLLPFGCFSFWSRPEPFQLLCVSASLLAATTLKGVPGALTVGVLFGVLWNLKFTGPLYSLPILVLVLNRSGKRAVAATTAIGVLTAALPFLLSSVSLWNYVEWVQASARTGLLLSQLRQNLEWALYLALPIWLTWRMGVSRKPSCRGGAGVGE